MGRVILIVCFVVSLAFNAAFVVHLLHMKSSAAPAPCPASLKLDPAQKARIQELRRTTQPRHEALQRRLDTAQAELVALLKATTADRAAVQGCIDTIAAIRKEMQQLAVEELLACKNFLSGEQCRCMLEMGAGRGKTPAPCSAPCMDNK